MLSVRTLASWAKRQPHVIDLVVTTLMIWQKRTATRRAIAKMESQTLRDIGLTPVQAQHECQKPFWRE